jgi:hypothetical protein
MRALVLLLWLQLGGWLRYLGRTVRTPRGALLVLVGLAVFLPWLMAMLADPGVGGRIAPGQIGRFGPAVLLLYCVLNVALSPTDRAIYFTPAEMQFLFAGPFSRRQVLAYKVVLTLLVSVPATLILALVVRVRDGWPPAVLTGLLLMAIFMQLFGVALALLASTIGQRLVARGRLIVRAAAVAVLAWLLLHAGGLSIRGMWSATEQALRSDVWQVVSWPLRSFFDVMVAERLWPDLVVPAAVGVAVNLTVLALIFVLDARYQEASAAASARLYARLQRLRGRSVGAESHEAWDVPAARPRFNIPALPYLGGVGPIFWRQLTAAVRGVGRLLVVLIVLGAVLAVPLLAPAADNPRMFLFLLMAAWMSIFLTTLVPFDFRGDIDRIAVLRALPIRPWCVALGQLLTPVLLLTVVEWLLLAFVAVAWPVRPLDLLACAAYVPVVNFLLVAMDNLLFLLFPVRLMAATPGDFQSLGRNVLLSLGKVIGLSVVLAVAGVAGAIGYGLTHGNLWVGVACAWPVVLLAGATLVPLIAWAFVMFDVGRDVPA